MRQLGYQSRFILVGSMGGVRRTSGEVIWQERTWWMVNGIYNEHLLTQGLKLEKRTAGSGHLCDDPRRGFSDSSTACGNARPELRDRRNVVSDTGVDLSRNTTPGRSETHRRWPTQEPGPTGVASPFRAEDQDWVHSFADEEYDFIIPNHVFKNRSSGIDRTFDEKPIIERLEQMGLIRNPGKDRSWINPLQKMTLLKK